MKKTRIGIIGCGAIGQGLALFINKSLKKSSSLCALYDMNKKAALRLKRKLKGPLQVHDNLDILFKKSDLIIEAASAEGAKEVLKKAIFYKKDTMILSTGALITNPSLFIKAKAKKVNIYIPSGAVCGIDGIGALACGTIKKLTLTTSKPSKALAGAEHLKKEKVIFTGSVKEAVKYFPKNINVAASLLLASSYKGVRVCIKANPRLKRNVHHIEIEAKEANISINIENVPSKLNPKTSALTILSAKYLLKKMFSPLKIGT